MKLNNKTLTWYKAGIALRLVGIFCWIALFALLVATVISNVHFVWPR